MLLYACCFRPHHENRLARLQRHLHKPILHRRLLNRTLHRVPQLRLLRRPLRAHLQVAPALVVLVRNEENRVAVPLVELHGELASVLGVKPLEVEFANGQRTPLAGVFFRKRGAELGAIRLALDEERCLLREDFRNGLPHILRRLAPRRRIARPDAVAHHHAARLRERTRLFEDGERHVLRGGYDKNVIPFDAVF